MALPRSDMAGRIAYFSTGLRQLEPEMRMLTGLEPAFSLWSADGADAVAGWGHKPTAARARAAACRAKLPYAALEDGFLRSLKPGSAQKPSAMVLDRSGIYYDSRGPSDLETMLETAAFSGDELARAHNVLDLIAQARLSKYNHGLDKLQNASLPSSGKLVLLVDQTFGDESIAGAGADAATFVAMAEAARAENPGAHIVARLHPETVTGAKPGYLLDIARRLGIPLLSEPVSPWLLFERQPSVYTVSSQLGFEAVLAGCRVTCFGLPFYAGWGLTDDRMTCLRRNTRRSREELAAAAYLRYSHYFDCWRRTPIEAETAIDQLAFLRRRYLANGKPVVGYRIARWKRQAVAAMLDGPGGPPVFTRSLVRAEALAAQSSGTIAAWGIEAVRLRPRLEARGLALMAVEDGFLRSVGLGAAFVQPLSLVFDRTGLYYDPSRPSDLETALAERAVEAADIDRARALRRTIVEQRITKYNIGETAPELPAVPPGREIILVPGQVADDWAVQVGRPATFPETANVNAVLLERVRAAHPGAFVIFKPHPDVVHLGRAGALSDKEQTRLADLISGQTSIEHLLPLASRVETFSSLSGFEALLRGIPVTVHGLPFYAGWGLTEDRAETPRRGRNRTIEDLIALALIHYPCYWDPVSRLMCPVEVIVERIAESKVRQPRGIGTAAGVLAGRGVIAGRRLRQRFLGH